MPPPYAAAPAWPPQPLSPAGPLPGPVPQEAAPGGRICHERGQGSPRQECPIPKRMRRVPEGSSSPSPISLWGQEGTQKGVPTPQTPKERSRKGSSLPKLWRVKRRLRKGSSIPKLREGQQMSQKEVPPPQTHWAPPGDAEGDPPAQTHWGKLRVCAFLPGCRPRCLLAGSVARMRLSSTAR